jgi:hypothetical protein
VEPKGSNAVSARTPQPRSQTQIGKNLYRYSIDFLVMAESLFDSESFYTTLLDENFIAPAMPIDFNIRGRLPRIGGWYWL